MAVPSLQFLAGLVLLLYLLSFVLFAFIRVVTGVSIQRLGYSGLRRIAFTPKDGLRIEIRGLGFSLHRPTFAQPTWVSIVLTELKITLDLSTFGEKPRKKTGWAHWGHGNEESDKSAPSTPESPSQDDKELEVKRTQTWKRLTEAKERIKRLHRKIGWIRLVDLVAHSTSIIIVDVGSVQIGGLSLAVDTRRKTVDRSRLFNHHKPKPDQEQRPAEWLFTARSIFFALEGKEPVEILDHCTLNVHGFLKKELEGLRDASIALKLGRLSIPADDLDLCVERAKKCRAAAVAKRSHHSHSSLALVDAAKKLDQPGAHEDDIVRTVSDSRDFASSILRGIHEFQFAVSFFGLTKKIQTANHSPDREVYLNVSMKEVGVDLLRLDPRSPAHLMYFSPNDIAHQVLLAAISISVGIDDGQDHPERLLHIPMATITLNTTLPSKTIQFANNKDSAERNTNILFANLVITSPSLDLDPKHLPLLLALFRSKEHTNSPSISRNRKRYLLRRLLPKASISTSIHEPVIRVTLPCMDQQRHERGEFDLLISASSSVSLDMESSHAADGELHYALNSTFRMNSQQLYYQTAAGEKHSLLLTDSLEFRVQLTAAPEVAVEIRGTAQTFSFYLVRPEISEGLRQIVEQIQKDIHRRRIVPKEGLSFLRRLPSWLEYSHLQGSDFNIEVAGIDPFISKRSRGVAWHLETWTTEYKQNRDEDTGIKPVRRRAPSRTINRDEHLLRQSGPSSPKSPRKVLSDPTDGRRLAIHLHGLEGLVIEATESSEQDVFLSLPRMEIAFSTLSDKQGPIFHTHSFAQSVYIQYSVYRHYAMGIAMEVLRRSFGWQVEPASPSPRTPQSSSRHLMVPSVDEDTFDSSLTKRETHTIDIKAQFVQIKANMPSDPPLMLQIFGLEAGRHRWTNPFMRSRLTRLYTQGTSIKDAWCRIVSIKALRLDYRQTKRRYGHTVTDEKSYDIATDAIRLAVPHQLVMHRVFDNVTNVMKTVKQLNHRFKTGTMECILGIDPEGPKRVPKISLRSRAVLFELEDDPFEWKLGTIYRIGLMEQKQRLAREQAFDMKVKKMQQDDESRGNSRLRARSTHEVRGRGKSKKREKELRFHRRTKSVDSSGDSPTDRSRADNHMRYNKDGFPGLSGSCKISPADAREALNRLNAQTWKKRIDQALSTQNRSMNDIRSMFWGLDEIPEDIDQSEQILMIPKRPSLMTLAVSDLDVTVDKPSFPLSEYPRFLARVGKGMPLDMQYSLLIPMNIQLNMGEAKVTLRDYPLPLLHFPAIGSIQSSRLPSVSMKTDFVIAEEYRDAISSRKSLVIVVPDGVTETGEQVGLAIGVRRTVAPVKTYSDMAIEINSAYPTRITWGTSYQPAIQDMMQIIENFTKPAIDQSERVGFWDKIRLTFHSRINVSWKGNGDVHLILKGSRDPYMVTGHGAGFVMCWQNDVRLRIAEDEDPRNFMMVNSGSYVLAIPDLSHYARHEADAEAATRPDTASSVSSSKQLAVFNKTIMKLNGNVRWVLGLVFERNVEGGGRSFKSIPHYNVTLKNPKYIQPDPNRPYDAFRGFRSHHIHLSIAIAAPGDRDWSLVNLEPSKTYNSVHLTPRFFTHFFSWWSTFSGAMSLPVRQGKLFPGVEKSSKKFGRHLATIKYNLLLSPLYISHIYKHKDAEDYGSGVVSATGLKMRVDNFNFDLHQRREDFRTLVQAPGEEGSESQNQTTGIRINQVQLDLIKPDIRAVSASIAGTDPDDFENATAEGLASFNQEHLSADLNKFTIPDNDWGWVDMDDFIELGWLLPSERHPEIQILPLAFAPRFTYFRQTDHAGNVSGDEHRTSSFGNEPTHHCMMSGRNDPRRVQSELIAHRIEQVKEQVAHNERAIGEQELKLVRELDGQAELRRKLKTFKEHAGFLQRKLEFLHSTHKSLLDKLAADDGMSAFIGDENGNDEYFEARETYDATDIEAKKMDSQPLADHISDFNNRFMVHNMHLKWNNSLRNIILRYTHQVGQRRGFVYYMSRKAVKFILDVVDDQNRSRGPSAPALTVDHDTPKGEKEADPELKERIEQLMEDGRKFVDADKTDKAGSDEAPPHPQTDAKNDVQEDYVAQNSYLVRLIAPQIQLQSEKDNKSAVLVTAKGMQLKVIQIMDKERVMDEVSGLVQRRFTAAMDSLQIFVTNAQTYASMEDLHMYSGKSYGAPAGSAWPPWVPFEMVFEYQANPFGFQRVVQRTSASMRYDKHNTLRLKYNDDVSKHNPTSYAASAESNVDQLTVDFPYVRAACDSRQYFAMYVIVMDLLLYSEPLSKTRNERLEKIMLASDFSDLAGAPSLVMGLQERIRQLEEIKTIFLINEKYLDKQGWEDRIEVEKDLVLCEDELFFVMKAITTAQRKQDDRAQSSQSTDTLRWYVTSSEIVWHLMREGRRPLAQLQLENVLFDRTDRSDGSNVNVLEIQSIRGFNLLEDAMYTNMIAPYLEPGQTLHGDVRCLRVEFTMLEAIAGIGVMKDFEVRLFPLKVELEYDIGKKLFEYIFPAAKGKNGENGNFSPFMMKHGLPAEDDEEEWPSSSLFGTLSGASKSISPDEDEVNELKMRLTPTLHLPDPGQKPDRKAKSSPEKRPSAHYFRFLRDTPSRSGTELRRTLHPNQAMTSGIGTPSNASSRPTSVRSGSVASGVLPPAESDRVTKRFNFYRTATSRNGIGERKMDKKKRSNDLEQMMSRASNYMTLAHVKVPSTVLCLSYKGKAQRDFRDVHDLVLKMPTLEYRNKTWSNLDLALQFKKDVIRALLSHAGAIVGNKFSQHLPMRTKKSRLRQMANSSVYLNTSPDFSGTDSASPHAHSPISELSLTDIPRRSFTSGRQPSSTSRLSTPLSNHSSPDISRHSSEYATLPQQPPPWLRDYQHPDRNLFVQNTWHNAGLGIELEDEERGRAFAEELGRVDNTEPGHANLLSSLSRHLTQVTPFAGHKGRERANSGAAGYGVVQGAGKEKEGGVEEKGEDGPAKKALAFGKKLLKRGSSPTPGYNRPRTARGDCPMPGPGPKGEYYH